MATALHVICTILSVYSFCIVLRAILSWIPVHGALATIYDFLYKITEVFLRPIRALLLKVEFIRNLRIDFSPIILIAIISLLERVLVSILLFL